MHVMPLYVPFAADARTDSFFAALATLLSAALPGPYGPGLSALPDGGAGARRHRHRRLACLYQAYSGVAFGHAWPADGSPLNSIPGWSPEWRYPDIFLNHLFGLAGLRWKRLARETGPDALREEVAVSVDAGVPVMLRLERSRGWLACVGLDDHGGALVVDGRQAEGDPPAEIADWREALAEGLAVTGGAAPSAGLGGALTQMILTLHNAFRGSLEKDVAARLEAAAEGPARAAPAAEALAALAGFVAEARGRAAEALPFLEDLEGGHAAAVHLRAAARLCAGGPENGPEGGSSARHCLRILELLGASPEAGPPPPEAAARLADASVRGEIARLWNAALGADRAVLQELRGAARAIIDLDRNPVPTVCAGGGYGARLNHVMAKLEDRSPGRPEVRIAFTGQSLVDPNNSWPPSLADWVRRRWPHARVRHKVFAIGGFSTQVLYRRVPNDMASFYPDLVIILVQGSEVQYEWILRGLRRHTAADILILTDHYTLDDAWGSNWWSLRLYYKLLPALARKYGAQMADIRTPWKEYFQRTGLSPQGLLSDGGHLNALGQEFMGRLVRQFLVHNPGAMPRRRETVIPAPPGPWPGGRWTVPFAGNRAEIVPGPGPGPVPAVRVRVDGRRPSQVPELYIRTAENTGITSKMGLVAFHRPPGEQTFTVTVKSWDGPTRFSYAVEGSATGPEGESDGRGCLEGRHVRLTDESFIFYAAHKPPVPGDRYRFTSLLNGVDTYGGPEDPGRPMHPEKRDLFCPELLFSGLPPGEHTLELETEGDPSGIAGVRIFNPGL